MPLSEKTRVEVYLPDLPRTAYQVSLTTLAQEFTYTFGGCTIVRGLDGSYLSQAGSQIQDRINLIYADTPYEFEKNFKVVSAYADKLKATIDTALSEEAVLVTVAKIYHAESG
ncbi:MAG TPA: hypothetical protein VLL54_13835 [Pyrinomonadaceae bacterium]|nr:hypothetical protein [Pyrinomonadaceae bacterium]